jgi:hypothetical protein
MSEVIKIGCRLPAGYTLEVGLQVSVQANGRPMTMLARNDDYQRIYLRGTHTHTADMRRKKIQVPSIRAPEPAYTKVPVAFWERWKKEHGGPRCGVLKSGMLFEVKDDKDLAAIQLDVMARPQPLAPINPEEIYRTDGQKVEKAVFDEDDKK